MGILTKFLATHILKGIESEFITSEPEIQAILLAEVKLLAGDLNAWIEKKVSITK
jgi:hypothetical protein